MTDTAHYFHTNGYVYLPDFLDKENCKQLVSEFQNLIDKGETAKDSQCPKSESIHGAAVFDSLLEQLTPHFEEASGLRLYPTYAYARWYAPGEVLDIHTDRPACEVSATLTLDFSGKPWPIYMADEDETGVSPKIQGVNNEYSLKNIKQIDMDVGDAVLYKGMEKVHWRTSFEGTHQVQVFLHYVNADGNYADQRYDGRESLTHHVTGERDEGLEYWYLEDAVPDYACEKIIEGYDAAGTKDAEIGAGEHLTVNKSIRNTTRRDLLVYKGIGATLAGIGLFANSQMWNFKIDCANQVDYLAYDKDGHYVPHVDTFFIKGQESYRKLTVLLFLNDDFEGGKLFLQTGHEKIYPPQKAGTVLVFPSFILHGVEPVISGSRRSIVTWMSGPWFDS